MQQLNVDLGLLTETKLMNGIYTWFSLDYHVVATESWNHSQGGVALFLGILHIGRWSQFDAMGQMLSASSW